MLGRRIWGPPAAVRRIDVEGRKERRWARTQPAVPALEVVSLGSLTGGRVVGMWNVPAYDVVVGFGGLVYISGVVHVWSQPRGALYWCYFL